jgi:antitoxin MazE
VRTNLVKIGNSHGVRIPKALIAAAHLGPEIELELIDGGLMMRTPVAHPRAGWDAAFRADPAVLTREERAWVDADLSASDRDWTW